MNAKKELVGVLDTIKKSIEDIKAIRIQRCVKFHWEKYVIQIDNINIDFMDFNYDDGYGSQELDGVVLFKDNTWLERGEYDGSEWWEYKTPPTIEDFKEQL